ncbi:MAG TPA: heavy-metal-associated domain-containing protein [Candidatus Pullichristensenella excrementipullorum]|nr:heavy-metal-associated domain-containing protein [Candidatus Pullichristensenella excrementipullorum]
MVKITAQVEGMRCGMCEAHVNEVVRRAFPVQKVTSSHARGQTVILAERDIADEELKKVIRDTGYEVTSIIREPYAQKKGLFSFLHR